MKDRRERLLEEADYAIKLAQLANDSFTHIFGEPTAREDYERTELEAMREGD